MHEAKFEPFESSQGSDQWIKMESFQKAKLSGQLELSPSFLESLGSSLIFRIADFLQFRPWQDLTYFGVG